MNKTIHWCPVHREEMETCDCGRDPNWPPGAAIFLMLLVAVATLISMGIGYSILWTFWLLSG